jgi:hypothetical protein
MLGDMAGGMNRGRPGEHDNVIQRLGLDRRTLGRGPEHPAVLDRPTTVEAERAARRQVRASSAGPRHVWVIDAPECPGRWPGVLLGWEQDGQGWLGRVAVEGREGMVTMTLWVRAAHLRPVQVVDPASEAGAT